MLLLLRLRRLRLEVVVAVPRLVYTSSISGAAARGGGGVWRVACWPRATAVCGAHTLANDQLASIGFSSVVRLASDIIEDSASAGLGASLALARGVLFVRLARGE